MRGERGFTLLEIVVAMTIMGGMLLALLSVLRGSLLLAGGACDLSAASVYASTRMEEALLAAKPSPGEEEGEFARDGTKYRWKLSTEPLPAEEGLPIEGFRFRVTVGWEEGGNTRSVELSATRWDRKDRDAGA